MATASTQANNKKGIARNKRDNHRGGMNVHGSRLLSNC